MNTSPARAASGSHAQTTDSAAVWDLVVGRTALTDIADPALTQALQDTLNNKTKPLGSLGRLEDAALKIGQILGTTRPVLEQPQMVVFAGDHGLTARGVSAFPSDVTWQMVENFLAGGAAVSVLSRQNGIALTVVDCGVKRDFLA
eukprot:gene19101-18978_t